MNFIIKSIPNTLTSASLVCGMLSCVFSTQGDFLYAMVCVLIGALFDFSDGFAARALNAASPIGKELDSLADDVTFGVAPGFMLYQWMSKSGMESVHSWFPYLAFLIPVFSALRLAKFNIDERQSTSFIGLPTPANAIFFTSAVYLASNSSNIICDIMSNPVIVVILIVSFSLLMVSELPMFSLKIKHLGWKGNEPKFVLIAFSIISAVLMKLYAIPTIIVFYILMAVSIWIYGRIKKNA